jgi:hypothetical protein
MFLGKIYVESTSNGNGVANPLATIGDHKKS